MKPHRFHLYRNRWHLAVTFGVVVLPFAFLLVFSRAAGLATGALFADVLISTWRLAVAYVIAAVIAWALAVSLARGRVATVALPIFDVLQSFPPFAILPLVTLAWGAGDITIIAFLVIAILWPILFAIVSSMKLVRHDWEEAVAMAQLRGFARLRYFLWPASVPGLITGSIIGLGDGWEALIATEIIVHTRRGLGPFFQASATNATITIFGVLGFLLLIFSINKLIWLPLLEWSHHAMEE